ncbi:MAG: bifunctional riboflavin kinase/FAD synthetase [Gilvibacter sp.]
MENKSSISHFVSSNSKPTVVTIGTFDGVHIGHTSIIDKLLKIGKKTDCEPVVLTFFPHPRMVLQPDVPIKLINTIEERTTLLKTLGVAHVIVHPFTLAFSRISAMEFVRDILVEKLGAKHVVIGYDHRFGRNRNANIDDLREFGKTYGFEVHEISAQDINAVTVSSTKIRRAIEQGDVKTASDYLGYHFSLSGTVVKGKGIGKGLGYATANLKVEEAYKIIPKKGVYVVQAILDGNMHRGIMSIGTNPTVGGTEQTIETFFLDYQGDLYDEHLTLQFLAYIRDELHFDTTQQLTTAIAQDEQFARDYVG